MSESSSTPWQTSASRLNDKDGEDDHDLTEGLDLGFDGAEDILRVWRRGIRPDPDLTVSQWADAHRKLSSRASAEPGQYRTSRTPYLRAIMDALSPGHPAQRITFMKAAQVGATEAGNNWIGFVIHHAPGPMLAVLPTVEMAKRTSRGRIDPLIEDRAFEDNPLTAPDLGLDGIAAEALATANTYRQAATDLANGASAPLTSWAALRDAVAGTGEDGAAALDDATASADRLAGAMAQAGDAVGGGGGRSHIWSNRMKTSLQFFKDMGVCDGAYAVLERVFGQAGVTEFDYAQGYQLMLGMMDQLEVEAAQSGEPGHDTAQGWLAWCYDLRNRPEAIMYFGDHIEEEVYRTADGQLHETLEAAQEHDRRRYAELRSDHAAARVINGVRFGEGGAETWEVVDPAQDDLAGFDAFVWHDSTTGLNHRTDSAAEAAKFDAKQANVLDAIEAAEQAGRIERRVSDESGTFAVWVTVKDE